jgi:hypothetical protein
MSKIGTTSKNLPDADDAAPSAGAPTQNSPVPWVAFVLSSKLQWQQAGYQRGKPRKLMKKI